MAAKKNDENQQPDLQTQLADATAEVERLSEENDRLLSELQDAASKLARRTSGSVDGLRVVLRRDAQVGDMQAKAGSVLAVVQLADAVSLNYLVDAIRNGLAGEALESE